MATPPRVLVGGNRTPPPPGAPPPAAVPPPPAAPPPAQQPPPAPIPQTFTPSVVAPPAPSFPAAPSLPPPAEFKPIAPPASSFGPGQNLIGTQIASAPTGANSFDTQAADYAKGAGVGGYSGQTDQARAMILSQLQRLQDAPDRFALAQSNYDQFQKDSEPAFQQQLRGVGQKAAAFGRIGAGMTTNDLTGALGQHQNLLSGERVRGLNSALENTLQDRLNVSGALNAGGGLLGGQDLSLNTARSNAALGQAGVFGGLGQSQAQREANAVAQQTQQQQYQSGLDQQNIMNQIAQQQLQQGAQQQSWQQQFAQQQLAAQIAAAQNTQYPGAYGGGPSSGQIGAGTIGFQG